MVKIKNTKDIKKIKKPIIQLENVWKIYQLGNVQVEALRGVDIDINIGEFVSITGPSGSGKSTMMNMVGALDIPTKGTIYLDGKDISKLGESDLALIRGKKIGFVFQTFNLISTLTAL
ncbi:MAG: ATP-binding cassette domain-containing protein, partial [Candidatus Woesearchaeota archaeon]|nr:ATP-binding cassette domain-containing protein [Candidatus Woesearchaeota archaeon]